MVLDECLPSWLGGNGAPVGVELGGAGGGQSTHQHWSPQPSPPLSLPVPVSHQDSGPQTLGMIHMGFRPGQESEARAPEADTPGLQSWCCHISGGSEPQQGIDPPSAVGLRFFGCRIWITRVLPRGLLLE